MCVSGDSDLDGHATTGDTVIRGTSIRDTVIRDAAIAETAARTVGARSEFDLAETQVRGTTTVTSTSGSRDGMPPATDDAPAGATGDPQRTRPVRLRVRLALDREVEFDLTATTIVGRNPKTPRVVTGAIELLAVESATGEISATHASVAPSGRLAVVTDLHSTNGTVVRVPGAAPQRLRGGETLVVAPGATIELGDGISIALLVPTDETIGEGR